MTATLETTPGTDPRMGKVFISKHPCGWCQTGQHARCRTGYWNPKTKSLAICPCKQHAGEPVRCRLCRHEATEGNPLIGDLMICQDQDGCAGRLADKADANPTMQMIREIRAALRTSVQTDEQGNEVVVVRKTRAERKAEARPKTGKCLCCGEATKGGLFLPGHDARFVSRLAADVESGDVTLDWAREKLANCSLALQAKFERKLEASK